MAKVFLPRRGLLIERVKFSLHIDNRDIEADIFLLTNNLNGSFKIIILRLHVRICQLFHIIMKIIFNI